MEVTKSITKIRKEKGYTQAKIAKKLQTTQQQYSKYEQGIQEIPVRHIITLCEIYNVTANKLLGIEAYITENESKNKFQRLYEEIQNVFAHARYQEQITYDQETLLLTYLEDVKTEIENE